MEAKKIVTYKGPLGDGVVVVDPFTGIDYVCAPGGSVELPAYLIDGIPPVLDDAGELVEVGLEPLPAGEWEPASRAKTKE